MVPSGLVFCRRGWVQRDYSWEKGLWKAGGHQAWGWVPALGTPSSLQRLLWKTFISVGAAGLACQYLLTLFFGRLLFGKLIPVPILEPDWQIWAGWEALGLRPALPWSLGPRGLAGLLQGGRPSQGRVFSSVAGVYPPGLEVTVPEVPGCHWRRARAPGPSGRAGGVCVCAHLSAHPLEGPLGTADTAE